MSFQEDTPRRPTPLPQMPAAKRSPVGPPASFNVEDQLYNLLEKFRAGYDLNEEEYAALAPIFWDQASGYKSQADQAWADALAGRGGYTPEELQAIRGAADYNQYLTNPGDYQDWYLSGDEQASIAGDPYSPLGWLNPGRLEGYADDAAARQREALERASYEMTVDPSWYMPDASYESGMRGAYETAARDAYGAIDPAKLALSEDFASNYPMSKGEVGQYAELAGRAAGTRHRATLDEISRRAAASGGTSSLAYGALADRYTRNSAIADADAQAQARLNADQARRGQLRDVESMRLDAERDIAGRKAGTALDVGSMRMSGMDSVAGRKQAGGAQYGGARLGAASQLLGARLGSAMDTSGLGIGVQQYITDTGAGYTSTGEQRASDRAGWTASNRQGTAQAAMGDRFNRGLQVGDRNVDREVGIAGMRYGDTQGARGYVADQANRWMANWQNQQDTRDRNRALSNDSTLAAAENWTGTKRSGLRNSIVNQFAGGAARKLFNL